MTRNIAASLLLVLAFPALGATIYKCTDEGGGTLISNSKVNKSCQAVVSGPDSSMPAPKARAPGAAANPSPAGFPKVSEDTQKARDTDRRTILDQEMAGEQRSLESAKKDLAEQEALKLSPDRLLPYRDRVAQHERNIQAIQKELNNLR